MKTARVVLIAFVAGVLFVAGCGRSVTAPEVTLEAIAAHCTAVDSAVVNGFVVTRYTCRVRFAPTP